MNSSDLKNYKNNINNISLNKVWKGHASAEMNDSFIQLKTTLNKAIEDVDKFDAILTKKEKYENICSELSRLYSAKSACESRHSEEVKIAGCGKCVGYSSDIYKNEYDRRQLREEILADLSVFEGIDVEYAEMMDLSINSEVRILVDLDALLDMTALGKLAIAPDGYGLYDMYNEYDSEGNVIPGSGEKYVNLKIEEMFNLCDDPRERTVNIGLLLIEMAALKGYRLRYENKGASGDLYWGEINFDRETKNFTYNESSGYNTDIVYNQDYNNINQIQDGSDCNAITCFLINTALSNTYEQNPKNFAWQWVGGLAPYGEVVGPNDVKPGDIFIYENSGHTGTVVSLTENPEKPGTGTIVVIESGGIYADGNGTAWTGVNEYSYYTTKDGVSIVMHNDTTKLYNYDKVYSGEIVSSK